MARTALVIQFAWDPRKAQSNQSKHEVGFEAAATVFEDARSVTIHDGQHSGAEDRWLTLGCDRSGKLLVVVHTWQEKAAVGAHVRIISARPATRRERQQYENSL